MFWGKVQVWGVCAEGMRREPLTSRSQNAAPEHFGVCAGYAPGVCGGPIPVTCDSPQGDPAPPQGAPRPYPQKPTGYAPRVCGAYIYTKIHHVFLISEGVCAEGMRRIYIYEKLTGFKINLARLM